LDALTPALLIIRFADIIKVVVVVYLQYNANDKKSVAKQDHYVSKNRNVRSDNQFKKEVDNGNGQQ
jgi:hypothetical protein